MAEGLCDLYQERMNALTRDMNAVIYRSAIHKSSERLVIKGNDLLIKAGKPGTQQPPQPKPAKQPAVNASGQQRKQPGQPAAQGEYQRPPGGVKNPGKRGGQFYYTATGHIRYGERPIPDARPATPDEIRHHFKHYRPVPLSHDTRSMRDMLKAINKLKLFKGNDKAFLDWWYGDADDPESIRDSGRVAFQESYGLTDEQMAGDPSNIEIEENETGRTLTYEQALHEFMMDQDWGEDSDPKEVEGLLSDLYGRFQDALKDPEVLKHAEAVAAEAEKATHGWFISMNAKAEHFEPLASLITAGADPVKVKSNMMMALGEGGMGLIFKPGKEQRAGGLKGVIAPNAGLLDDDEGYLIKNKARLNEFSAPQLMTVWIGSQLQHMWDPERRGFHIGKTETDLGDRGVSIAPTNLSTEVMKVLRKKLGLNSATADLIEDNLISVTRDVALDFDNSNLGAGDLLTRKLIDQESGTIGDEEHLQKLREMAEHFEKIKEEALEAQKDDSFKTPASMKDGRVGGKQINPKTGKPWGLFTWQKQGINWMYKTKRGILAHFAGAGKTLQIVGLMERLKEEGKAKRAILFLPPALMAQWPAEIASFSPEMGKPGKILNLSGMSLEERKIALESDMAANADYILMSTGTLSDRSANSGEAEPGDDGGMDDSLVETLRKMEGAVFIDEVHQGGYKTKGSVRHELAKKIIGDRDYAFGMSATPIPNTPIDVKNLIDMFAPDAVGSDEEWEGKLHGVRYDEDTKQWSVDHPEGIAELNKRIKPFCFSKTRDDPEVKAELKAALPDLNHEPKDLEPSHDKCPVTGLSQFDYIRPGGACETIAVKQMEVINRRRKKEKKDPLIPGERNYELTLRLITLGLQRQCAISPKMIDPRYTGPSPKIDTIAEDIRSHFADGGGKEDSPILVFSSYPKKAFKILKEKLYSMGVDPSGIGEISGEKSAAERAFVQDMVNGYESSEVDEKGKKKFVQGRYKLCLIGTKSGGAGLNLQKKARKMFFMDEPWTPADKEQAIARAWRPGRLNQDPVDACTYRVKGTTDINTEEKLAGKQTMVTAMLGTPDPTIFSKDATKQIMQIGGRVAEGGISSQQMGELLAVAGDIAIDKDFLGEEFDRIHSDGDIEDDEDLGADLEQFFASAPKGKNKKPAEEGYSKEAEAAHAKNKPKLEKVAPNLTINEPIDDEKAKWRVNAAKLRAHQVYDTKMTVAKVWETRGDKEKADNYKRQAERIKAQYPEAFGEEVQQRSAKDVERDKQYAEKVNQGDKSSAVKVNERNPVSKKDDPHTYKLVEFLRKKGTKNAGDLDSHVAEFVDKNWELEGKDRAKLINDFKKEVVKVGAVSVSGARPAGPAAAVAAAPAASAQPPKAVSKQAPAAKETPSKQPLIKLADKNPINAKKDEVGHAAYEYLAKKKLSTHEHLDQHIADFVEKKLVPQFGKMSKKTQAEFAENIKKELLRVKAVTA